MGSQFAFVIVKALITGAMITKIALASIQTGAFNIDTTGVWITVDAASFTFVYIVTTWVGRINVKTSSIKTFSAFTCISARGIYTVSFGITVIQGIIFTFIDVTATTVTHSKAFTTSGTTGVHTVPIVACAFITSICIFTFRITMTVVVTVIALIDIKTHVVTPEVTIVAVTLVTGDGINAV